MQNLNDKLDTLHKENLQLRAEILQIKASMMPRAEVDEMYLYTPKNFLIQNTGNQAANERNAYAFCGRLGRQGIAVLPRDIRVEQFGGQRFLAITCYTAAFR